MSKVSGNEVTAYVPTKNRYYTTLASCLIAVALQTVKPKRLIIFDDGDRLDLRTVPLYKNIFSLLEINGIKWEVMFGERQGQVKCHQKALEIIDTPWIWRLDDDNIAEHNALEKMLEVIDDGVGAVGGLVLHPTHFTELGALASAKIEDVDLGLNPQWYTFKGVLDVDHIYSTFLYRKVAGRHGYNPNLTPVGHNEETLFTYEMKRSGWKLLINSEAVTWHLREATGGIRSFNANPELWEQDKQTFRKKLKEWNVTLRQFRFAVLDSGIGDHIVFKRVLQTIKKKHPKDRIVVACCYPDIFKDDDVKTISIGEAKAYFGDIDKFNIYKWMWDRKWDKPLEEAFRGMYL